MENEVREESPCWNSSRKTENKRKEREIERKEGKGKERRRREEEGRTCCSLNFFGVRRTKEQALFKLQDVGVFSSPGYSCLRAI